MAYILPTPVMVDDMQVVAKAISDFRSEILFSDELEETQFDDLAKEEFLVALAQMELAAIAFRKCALLQARFRASRP